LQGLQRRSVVVLVDGSQRGRLLSRLLQLAALVARRAQLGCQLDTFALAGVKFPLQGRCALL
jgi:hypothetical protein